MKRNWKFAIMAFAVAMMSVSCDPKGGDPIDDDDDDDDVFVSLINVDGDASDWSAIESSKVAQTTCAEGVEWSALKTLKVYADQMYINILVEFDESKIVDKAWVPFHVYLDADNSDDTGGNPDQFADADMEVMLESAVFAENEPNSWDPGMWDWASEAGTAGWGWTTGDETNNWGATVPEGSGIANSASKGNVIEIQILREAIPATFADTFGIGVDIQQNWSSAGVLPNAANNAETGEKTFAPLLRVTIDAE